MADHLSYLEKEEESAPQAIRDSFPYEFLLALYHIATPWYADIANYLVRGVLPEGLSHQQRKRFLYEVRQYLWEDPYLYKIYRDGMIRRCIPDS